MRQKEHFFYGVVTAFYAIPVVLPWHLPSYRWTSANYPQSWITAGCRRYLSGVHLLLRRPPSWRSFATSEGCLPLMFVYYLARPFSPCHCCFSHCSLLQCPVLIGWGDKDPWEPIELGRNYESFESVEDFVVLPNVGHCPQVFLALSLCYNYAYLFRCGVLS